MDEELSGPLVTGLVQVFRREPQAFPQPRLTCRLHQLRTFNSRSHLSGMIKLTTRPAWVWWERCEEGALRAAVAQRQNSGREDIT